MAKIVKEFLLKGKVRKFVPGYEYVGPDGRTNITTDGKFADAMNAKFGHLKKEKK